MKIPDIFNRDELSRILWGFRYELIVAGVFSLVANLLMLTPTIYMLQVYDRVMLSQSMGTLTAVSLIALFFFGVLTFSEWCLSKLLVISGVRLDGLLSKRLFHASYEAYLNPEVKNPLGSFNDLTELRQFLTGNGIYAFFDAPWAPIYIAVLFMLQPNPHKLKLASRSKKRVAIYKASCVMPRLLSLWAWQVTCIVNGTSVISAPWGHP